jgi:hypothetical protein
MIRNTQEVSLSLPSARIVRVSEKPTLVSPLDAPYQSTLLKFPEPLLRGLLQFPKGPDTLPRITISKYFYRRYDRFAEKLDQQVFIPNLKREDIVLFLKKIRNGMLESLTNAAAVSKPFNIYIEDLSLFDSKNYEGLWANVLLAPYIYDFKIIKQPGKAEDLFEIWEPPPNSDAKAKIEPFDDRRIYTESTAIELVCTITSVTGRLLNKGQPTVVTGKVSYKYPSDEIIVEYLRKKRATVLNLEGPKSLRFILLHNLLKPYIF